MAFHVKPSISDEPNKSKTGFTNDDMAIFKLFSGLSIFLVGFAVVTGIYFSTEPESAKPKIVSLLNKSDFIKPTPTIIPTPTPIPGYCLHIPILLYHHIEPLNLAKTEGHESSTVDSDIFDTQMKYLSDHGYHTVNADELVASLRNHSDISGPAGKTAMITLDDGYSDNYIYAFPIAKKYHVILNLMIPTGLLDNPGYLTWDNLKEMVSSGQANAYDHTWSHYSMPRGSEEEEQEEIMTAKNQLEQKLGKPVTIFAYPYGSISNRSVSLLTKDGFSGAFSTIPGQTQCDSIIYNLRRNRIGNSPLSAYGL